MWLCQCECGKQSIVQRGNLRNGNTKSCSCLRKEVATQTCKQKTTHGQKINGITSPIYAAWVSMIQRCTNLNNKDYKHYGGRGIKVCKTWMKFEMFFQDMGEKPKELSLDRVDNNGDYCKENCKWSTRKEQQRNTWRTILIIIKGITKCLAEWCEIYSMNYNMVRSRLYYGWTPEEALELIPRVKSKRKDLCQD